MFYTFRQNNSYGRFDYDGKRGISVNVIVEANSIKEANEKAEEIGLYFDGVEKEVDCECCGDRWDKLYEGIKYDDGTVQPTVYGNVVLGAVAPSNSVMSLGSGKHHVFVHYKDGSFKGFWSQRLGIVNKLSN